MGKPIKVNDHSSHTTRVLNHLGLCVSVLIQYQVVYHCPVIYHHGERSTDNTHCKPDNYLEHQQSKQYPFPVSPYMVTEVTMVNVLHY